MKLVKEHINEAIKHLKPRSFEEIEESHREDLEKVFQRIHELIENSDLTNDRISPEMVDSIAFDIDIHLSSDDVVYISNTYDEWEEKNYPEVNEAIKHLKPRSPEEVDKNFDEEIKTWISDGLSGKNYITEKIYDYLDDSETYSETDSETFDLDFVKISDELLVYIFYNFLNEDEEKLIEAIKHVIKHKND
jgi:hypothetical protein